MRRVLSLAGGTALGIAVNLAGAYAQCSQWAQDVYGRPVQMAVPCPLPPPPPPPVVFDPLGAFFGGLGAGIAGGFFRPGYGYGYGHWVRSPPDGGHRGYGGGMQRQQDRQEGGGEHRR